MTGFWNWMLHGQEWGFTNFVTFMPLLPASFWAICATFAEFFGGILVLLGYWTRLGSLAISIVMIVALFGVHFPEGTQPDVSLVSEIEFPLALLAIAISLLMTGPGRYSVKIKK